MDPQTEWWLSLVEEPVIHQHFKTLGVYDDIEMVDGTGLKLLINQQQVLQLQDTSIQLSS